MTPRLRHTAVLALTSLLMAPSAWAQHTAIPAGMTHEEHMAQMKKDAEMKGHGNLAMGFDQDKAKHHFTLTATGGVIAVSANDAADQRTRDQVRSHLQEITQAFGQGDFEKPLMTPGEIPPGVATMRRLKTGIAYTFETTEGGGTVRITTSNADALDAIHDFLRYQIKEHATGDSSVVQQSASGDPINGMRAMMAGGHDAATMAQMGDIHELFMNHDRMTRTVTNLPDGIRSVTASDDPRIAQLLKDHVAAMQQRVGTGNDPGLPIESSALRALFQNHDKIQTTIETTANGVVVVQTSSDPITVALLQQHASEVTDFVNQGMAAMHAAMMRNRGGMMGGGMHHGTVDGGPTDKVTPDPR